MNTVIDFSRGDYFSVRVYNTVELSCTYCPNTWLATTLNSSCPISAWWKRIIVLFFTNSVRCWRCYASGRIISTKSSSPYGSHALRKFGKACTFGMMLIILVVLMPKSGCMSENHCKLWKNMTFLLLYKVYVRVQSSSKSTEIIKKYQKVCLDKLCS